MKKLLSIMIAIVMVVSVGVSSTAVAMASTVASIESTTKKPLKPTGEVNGQISPDVSYEVDPNDPNKITFTYDGDGDLLGWEFLPETFREGIDYRIVSEDGNSITIELINGYSGDVIANAIVDFPEGEEKESTTAKKNSSNKSPNTGIASATGLGVAVAGAAILVALKKKEDAE